MMPASDNYWTTKSDKALMEAIGEFIKENRLRQNKSQEQLAKEAGIHRTTLIELEQGKNTGIITLIQVLRALNLLEMLQVFEISQEMSPMQLAALQQEKRKRASKS